MATDRKAEDSWRHAQIHHAALNILALPRAPFYLFSHLLLDRKPEGTFTLWITCGEPLGLEVSVNCQMRTQLVTVCFQSSSFIPPGIHKTFSGFWKWNNDKDHQIKICTLLWIGIPMVGKNIQSQFSSLVTLRHFWEPWGQSMTGVYSKRKACGTGPQWGKGKTVRALTLQTSWCELQQGITHHWEES